MVYDVRCIYIFDIEVFCDEQRFAKVICTFNELYGVEPTFSGFTQLDKVFPTVYLNKNFVTMFS